MEFLIQLLGELLLQMVAEALAELGLRGGGKAVLGARPKNRILATLGYAILGAVAGGISLIAFPDTFVKGDSPRMVNLIVTPVVAGVLMAGVGAALRTRGRQTIRLESFAYGFTFAFALGLVRFLATR